MPLLTLGWSIQVLIGNSQFSYHNSLLSAEPPKHYDQFLRYVSLASTATNPATTHWTLWAFSPNADCDFYSTATAKKKYKPVDRKVHPVPTYMPDPITQQFKPIPLPPIQPLLSHPPSWANFKPTTCMTQECFQSLLDTIPKDFLSSSEINLLAYVVDTQQLAFTFTFAEKGIFKQEYYPNYEIPTIEHMPWQQLPVRIPKALEDVLQAEILEQKGAGWFEDTTSSYWGALFAVVKKGGWKVHLVIDLQKLNAVTIRDTSLPPCVEDFTEGFVGWAIYGAADLFTGFDTQIVSVKSRLLTAFYSIVGPLQQCTLPMGYTNLIQEFQCDITHALGADVPEACEVFIDNAGIKGLPSDYNGETIPGNPEIRRFIYEYATTLECILAWFIAAGITASRLKTTLASPTLTIVGSVVSLQGWHLKRGLVSKVEKWPPCTSVSEVWGFLGTIRCGRK